MTRRRLNLFGEVCPVPLWRTQEALAELSPQSELEVATDFARSVRNITQWCARQGYSYEIGEQRDGTWRVLIRKP